MKNKYYILILILLGGIIYSINHFETSEQSPKTHATSQDSILSPKLLNSERIKMKYGSYNIKVLSNTPKLRVSNLYSSHNDKKITRTLAIVHYLEEIDSIFLNEHVKILSGGSIGRVFKQHGWKIKKKSIYLGELQPSIDYSNIYKRMGNISISKLAIHIYGFYIEKDNKDYQYAVISEIYHPDYLTLNNIKQIVINPNKYLEKNAFSIQILKQVESKMKNGIDSF
ncbi:hypothetical protein [Flavivirga eckloniae]|uniref:Uncharacterized protein n=1 Tax=Flavivirga eckloniae TaxID=1803846 RepID=A0A2K9PLB0_9FLAO|nr:hypothetical protein [Flavivirga eckloniae]AUP77859.1 hypothetical protein C1H87_03655 [Flavivirga eckloniae]